jgi:hypothetical protein
MAELIAFDNSGGNTPNRKARRGKLSIKNNQSASSNYKPVVNSTNKWIIVSDSNHWKGKSTAQATPIFFAAEGDSEQDLIDLVNGLRADKRLSAFNNLSDATSWCEAQNFLIMLDNQLTNGTVTDGLAVGFDATLGVDNNTIFNTVGDGENGVLSNGPVVGSDSIFFDGVDDTIEIFNYGWNHDEVTVCAFINPALDCPSGDNNIVTVENAFEYRYNNVGNGTATMYYASNPWAWYGSGTITLGQWQMLTFRHDVSAGLGEIWSNDTTIFSKSINGPVVNQGGNMKFMGRYCCDGSPARGDLGVVLVYNRALTDAEITQNYNALRGKYGV